MSSTVDVNVLLYSSDESSPFHAKAKGLVRRLAEGPDLLYLFWPVLLGYLRMSTHSVIFPRPLSVETATQNIDHLLDLPHARTAGEREDFWPTYRAATAGAVVAGNLVPDAHLVALMRENEVGTLWSHDRDFRKFDGITVRDPFA
ncbi:MAG TPA: TA system VapC family ribonuclease toxin [Candidatus Limnocylindrales bacterium]|nr:TA system VapC family ribonuclease toxin [Candidatus Limnocylindrales bacterium]